MIPRYPKQIRTLINYNSRASLLNAHGMGMKEIDMKYKLGLIEGDLSFHIPPIFDIIFGVLVYDISNDEVSPDTIIEAASLYCDLYGVIINEIYT